MYRVRTCVCLQGKNPLYRKFPKRRIEPAGLHYAGQRAQTLPTSYSGPRPVDINDNTGRSQTDKHFCCRFRMTLTRTKNVEKASYHDQEFSGHRQKNHNNIIIIIIAFKGTIRHFLQSPHSAANCLQHERSSGPGRNRVQITCNTSSAYHVQVSCYGPLGTKGQLSYLSLPELKSHLFELYFIG